MAGVRLSTLVRQLRRESPAGGSWSDADLLARFCRDRDDAAFELLVWRHGAVVLGACRRVLGHTEDAEDAFQAVFLVLARKAGGVSRGEALPAWLHRVATRIAGRLARSRRPTTPLGVEPPARSGGDPVERADGLAILDEEINRLPDRLRRAVVLCYLEGLTAAEAGRQLGCPTGTVESRLAAARKTLRGRLTRRGVTLPAGVLAVLAGQGTLAPEAVARVVPAAAAYVREGAKAASGIVGESSVRLAKRAFTMWKTRTWGVIVVVAAAVAVTAGVGWADRDRPAGPVEPPAVKATATPPRPPAAAPPTEAGKPADAWPLARQIRGGRDFHLLGVDAGGRIVATYSTASVVLWDLSKEDSAILSQITSPNGISGAAISPDGKLVATAEVTNGVKLREAMTGKLLDALWPSGGLPAHQVEFSPDGSQLTALCWRYEPSGGPPDALEEVTLVSQVSVWDLASKKEIGHPVTSVRGPHLPVEFPRVRLTADGRFVLKVEAVERSKKDKSGEISCRLTLTDGLSRTTGRSIDFKAKTRISPPGVPPTLPEWSGFDIDLSPIAEAKVTVSGDGKSMIVARSHELAIYDTATGKERARLGPMQRVVKAAAFSADGKLVAAATGLVHPSVSGEYDTLAAPTEVVIWETATGKELGRLTDKETNPDYSRIRFSPNGSFIVARDTNGGLTIWGRPPQPKPAATNTETKGPEAGTAVSPAGVPERFQALFRDLAPAAVTDQRRIECLFLAALGRLPNDVEARTLAAQLGKQTDKSAALRDLLNTLVETAEFKAHAAALGQLAK